MRRIGEYNDIWKMNIIHRELVLISVLLRQTLMDSMAAQKDSDFCVKEEPRMAVEDLVQLFVDRDTLAK